MQYRLFLLVLVFVCGLQPYSTEKSSSRRLLEQSLSRRLLARPPGHEALGAKCDLVTDVTTPFFGIGKLEHGSYYADNQTCTWQFSVASGQSTTLMFSMFQLEKDYDFVEIFQDSRLLVNLTGELIVPYSVVLQGQRIEMRFHADDTYHEGAMNFLRSWQIGFNASYKVSRPNECPYGCGTGSCVAGKCVCINDRVGADCSVEVRSLTVNASKTIEKLEAGKWAYFVVRLGSADNALIEVDDFGSPDSDAMLAMNATNVPTLSSVLSADWFDWYYDASDIHLLRIGGRLQATTYFFGLTNHIGRGEAVLDANITLRTRTDGSPCILDCAGHGTCNPRGSCICDHNATGYHMDFQVCNYPFEHISTSSFPYYDNVTVRVGDWRYYKFTVHPDEAANGASLLVSLWSKSPRARPILLVRKNLPPSLVWGYVPTYDAFIYDFGDERGFDMLTGMQQNILINSPNLTAGDWYVGVYDIWGYTGIEVVSHDSATVDLYMNLFQAGKPCPRAKDNFCAGEECDFNTGVCQCPINKLGPACAFDAKEIRDGVAIRNARLAVGMSHYYVLNVTTELLSKGHNFHLVMNKSGSDKAYPYLLARFGELPFSENYTEWDDHDLTAHYYHEQTHSILLDREELKLGLWYFSIMNTQESEAECIYDLLGVFANSVPCPEFDVTPSCSGKGTCKQDYGRCVCDTGRTMDDCSALGVFPLAANSDAADTPEILVDSWAYWSILVGCANRSIEVVFREQLTGGRIHESAPLLVMRQNKLPLMVEGTNDYFDYFKGSKDHSATQAIAVSPCEGEMASCVIFPSNLGTNYSTGYIKPGVWFVGLYNDFQSADTSISSYSLHYTSTGPACTTCAEGFLSPPACNVLCPGMMPLHAYTNTPFLAGVPCSGHGNCSQDTTGQPVCKCDPFYFGAACELECPGMRDHNGTKVACAGHGTCDYPLCICQPGYSGPDCSVHCPGIKETGKECGGNGKCSLNAEGDTVCQCSQGFAGEACTEECPGKCSSHGVCQLVFGRGGPKEGTPTCECNQGYLGDSCDKACPGVTGRNGTCNGQGTCELNTAQVPTCTCFHGFSGQQCEKLVAASEPAPGATTSYGGLAVGLTILALVLAAGVAYLVWLSRRQKAALERYRLPMLDGAVPTSDDAETAQAKAEEQGQEMQPMATSDGPVDVL